MASTARLLNQNTKKKADVMLKYHLNQVWNQLRGKKPHLDYFLEEVHIDGLRGIRNLNVRFNYPVSVLSGPNACGKSTILSALACAYKVPDSGLRDFVPSTVFPDFLANNKDYPSDISAPTSLEFYYIYEGSRYRMRWSRGKKNWNKSFLGLKGGRQPERLVYLRTMSHLSNPSEVRGVLQLGQQESINKEEISVDLLTFAYRILPLRYLHIFLMSYKEKDILFAEREDGGHPLYSEFHMSAGERAILRMSKDISRYNNAMILIDELEAGLHPFTQQQIMLELQRLALRNNLQIIVTTHSPVIIESVPVEGRIFLERTADNNVEVHPPYRDIIQKSFYGRSIDKLSILCEDEVAEALLRGVLDVLNPQLNLTPSDIEVGKDTGKDEFPSHVRALAKFNQLENFIFVLDGDAHDKEAEVKQAAANYGQPIKLIFLPGTKSPEDWIWTQIKLHPNEYAEEFSMISVAFSQCLENIERAFNGAADTPRNIAKGRLLTLENDLAREIGGICRVVGRKEAVRQDGTMLVFVKDMEDAIQAWRSDSR
ncbi:MAG: AAA family ATPase [Methanothrix sp.]|nr:AAA family ATPase [Methanothrix sp.]MDD4448011.1 AAA family ATPase [Methanothrix sp.]